MAMEAATGDEDVMGMYDKAAGVYALARGAVCWLCMARANRVTLEGGCRFEQ